jgi:hypothetical protein
MDNTVFITYILIKSNLGYRPRICAKDVRVCAPSSILQHSMLWYQATKKNFNTCWRFLEKWMFYICWWSEINRFEGQCILNCPAPPTLWSSYAFEDLMIYALPYNDLSWTWNVKRGIPFSTSAIKVPGRYVEVYFQEILKKFFWKSWNSCKENIYRTITWNAKKWKWYKTGRWLS